LEKSGNLTETLLSPAFLAAYMHGVQSGVPTKWEHPLTCLASFWFCLVRLFRSVQFARFGSYYWKIRFKGSSTGNDVLWSLLTLFEIDATMKLTNDEALSVGLKLFTHLYSVNSIIIWTRGANVPCSFCSHERKFQGTKVPRREGSRERKFLGAKVTPMKLACCCWQFLQQNSG